MVNTALFMVFLEMLDLLLLSHAMRALYSKAGHTSYVKMMENGTTVHHCVKASYRISHAQTKLKTQNYF